jgi:hypothetical protein
MNRLLVVAAIVLPLMTAPALAGVVAVPVGGHTFENVSDANVEINNGAPDGAVRISTMGLSGRFDTTPGGAGPAGAFIGVTQEQTLLFDPDTGTITGRARGRLTFTEQGIQLNYRGNLTGIGSCVSGTGRRCAQLVVSLKLEGVIADPNNPQRVGVIRMELLGSLVRDEQGGRWVTLEDNATLYGSEEFRTLSLTTMAEGETCGV